MADPVMPSPTGPPAAPPEPPAPAIPAPRRAAAIECQFCDCQLMADGAVLKTSERARALQKAEDTIAQLQGRVRELETENRQLKERAPEKTRRGIDLGV